MMVQTCKETIINTRMTNQNIQIMSSFVKKINMQPKNGLSGHIQLMAYPSHYFVHQRQRQSIWKSIHNPNLDLNYIFWSILADRWL